MTTNRIRRERDQSGSDQDGGHESNNGDNQVGWLVWFKRYILLGPRAGALTLLQGLVYGGRPTYSEARPGI